MIVLVKVAE